jgi:hypothetical protein
MTPKFSIAIALILGLAASSAGCTDTVPPPPAVTVTITPVVSHTGVKAEITKALASQTPAAATQPAPAVTQVEIFGTYQWVEYRENNSVTMPPNPRYQWEGTVKTVKSEDTYQGTPAVRYTITYTGDYTECCTNNLVTRTKNGDIIVSEMTYAVPSGAFLRGTMVETIKGETQPAVNLPADPEGSRRDDKPSGLTGITPMGEMKTTLTDRGVETVTVPAGTYAGARKYTGSFRDGTPITFWVVPGIPVPVQYQFPNRYLDGVDPFQSYELMKWE